jgi:hypothetical protein
MRESETDELRSFKNEENLLDVSLSKFKLLKLPS